MIREANNDGDQHIDLAGENPPSPADTDKWPRRNGATHVDQGGVPGSGQQEANGAVRPNVSRLAIRSAISLVKDAANIELEGLNLSPEAKQSLVDIAVKELAAGFARHNIQKNEKTEMMHLDLGAVRETVHSLLVPYFTNGNQSQWAV